MRHSKAAAEKILQPYMDALAGLFPAAWERWEKLGEALPEYRMNMCPRTRASMLHNFAATDAEAEFDGMAPDVTLHKKRGLLLVGFDSQLYLRFKKYRNANYATSGIATDQQQAFEAQQPLTGFQESTNIVLGYVLNPLANGIASMAVTCSTDGVVDWAIDVPIPAQAAVVDLQPKIDAPVSGADAAVPEISSTIREDRAEDGGIGG